jgi:signal transduction histidine kinase
MIAPARQPDRSQAGLGAPNWVIAYLTRRPDWGPLLSSAVVLGLVLLIGTVDYIIGISISLRVFYYIPIGLAVAWLGLGAAVLTSVASVGVWLLGDYLAHSPYIHRPVIWWNASIVFCMFVVVAWVLDALIVLHRELEERVRERTAALEQEVAARTHLQGEILQISERERGAIGHDLHDGLCQHLTGTALAAQVLAEQLAAGRDPAAAEAARGVVALVQDGIGQTRGLARGLLLAAVKPDRLTAELEELASSVSGQHGVACQYIQFGEPHLSDAATASHLFRIAQEAVRNALRHGQPRHVVISLEADAAGIALTVSDDGVGVAENRAGPGLGLQIMAHRAEVIRAEFAVEPARGGGTCVRCRVPAASA